MVSVYALPVAMCLCVRMHVRMHVCDMKVLMSENWLCGDLGVSG